MAKISNERQQGISALLTLLRKYGTVFVGEVGLDVAYHAFLSDNGVKLRKPLKSQMETLSCLRIVAPVKQGKYGR